MGLKIDQNMPIINSEKDNARAERKPYNPKNLLDIMVIKLLGKDKSKIIPSNIDRLRPLNTTKNLRISRLLAAPEKAFDNPNVTYMDTKADFKLIDIFWTQISEQTRLGSNNIFLRATKAGVEFVKKFTAIRSKIYTTFSYMMKQEYKLAKTEKNHKLDTITGLAGVFDQGLTLKSAENDDRSLSPYQQIQDALGLSIGTYLKHLSEYGGYYQNATQDSLNSNKIQRDAKKLSNIVNSDDGWLKLLGDQHPTATRLNELFKAKDIGTVLQNLKGFNQDPNTILEIFGDNVKFISKDLNLTPNLDGLKKIVVRVFNKDCTHFADISAAQVLNFTPEELKLFVEQMKIGMRGQHNRQVNWQKIDLIESDNSWPPFLLSIIDDENPPPQYSKYRASQGRTMLELNLNISKNSNNKILARSSHPTIDGQAQLAYSNVLEAGLDTVKDKDTTTTFIKKNAPLYEMVSTPKTVEELLNNLGLSDVVVGMNYDYQNLVDEFTKLNLLYDQGYSNQISMALEKVITKDTYKNILLSLRMTYNDEASQNEDIKQLIATLSANPNPSESELSKFRDRVRNLLCPKISFIHLFGAILAREGGVVNCVAPMLESQRLQLAIVQGILKPELEDSNQLRSEAFSTLSLNLLEQSLSKLGLSTLGYLTSQTGEYKDPIAAGGDFVTPELVKITNDLFAQTSDIGASSLDMFISALSSFNNSLSLSIGHTYDKKTGVGHLTARANLTKVSILNRLELIPQDIIQPDSILTSRNVMTLQPEKIAMKMLKTIKNENPKFTNYEVIQEFMIKNNYSNNRLIQSLDNILTQALLRKLQFLFNETQNTLFELTGKDTIISLTSPSALPPHSGVPTPPPTRQQ